jgi:casein kinase II subunit alpha
LQLISLIWGGNWHIFKPNDLSLEPGSERYALEVFTKQVNFFGPVPLKYQEIADEDALDVLTMVINHVKDTLTPKPFAMAENPELSVEDRDFLCRIMKFDRRDRPTAGKLLEDEWFRELQAENFSSES